HLGFTSGRHYTELLLQGKEQRRVQTIAGALLTAFFLTHLTGTREYVKLLESDVKHAKITYDSAREPVRKPAEKLLPA
ncbi:MAG: hypothetical protein J2O49_01770, partial [Sciscionella sp.]|nr:hypothetical protein [Sciscionella sp.]